ncbi:MAG: hypothetical protein LRY51_08470, partial [Geovibrio sp.]|nr:hypothetical protein [Geovibrio sp.]
DPDMTYRGMISAHTSIPEDELEISEKETEIPRIQAFSLLHELAHFEAEGDPVNHTSRTLLSAEIYCDSRALDGLAIQKDFNNDHFYRNWILMRAVQDTNNSIQRAVKNHIKCRAASSSGGMGCRPDFSHSTALFLKNPDHTASCEEVIQEYNSLLLALYSTIRCEWGLSIEDRISKTYKAACLLLERGGSDNLILSPLQREILELYTEGMEHFCPTKCQCWRGELESKTIPVSSDQVYDRALEAGL